MALAAAQRAQMLQVLAAAIRAVDPQEAVRAHLRRDGALLQIGMRTYCLNELDRILVVGGGCLRDLR